MVVAYPPYCSQFAAVVVPCDADAATAVIAIATIVVAVTAVVDAADLAAPDIAIAVAASSCPISVVVGVDSAFGTFCWGGGLTYFCPSLDTCFLHLSLVLCCCRLLGL